MQPSSRTRLSFSTLDAARMGLRSEPKKKRSSSYDFIGFQVSKPLLQRAFPVVYGVELKDVLTHEDLAIGSYRYSISRLIPEIPGRPANP
jgi:hypothetical protein